ncbi:MAG: hypothetical protein IPH61_09045 [Bacteroidetes bacterium]|nr:hypothetical protein [Bacteroidota bacterium]
MKFLIFYFSILISLHSYSQTFNNTIDVDNNIQGFHDILYTDSIIFCSGWNHEPGVQQSILVSGFQLNGDESIQQYFGNPDYNHTENRLIQINDSLIALFGNQDIDPIENPLNNDIVILIFKKDGELISEQSYGDENIAEAVKSIMYYSDTIYITGFYADLIENHTQTFLWLFSPTGDSLALFTYGHPDWNFIGNKIIRAQNGDFLIAGYAMDGFERDRLLLRISSNGIYCGIRFIRVKIILQEPTMHLWIL